MFMLLPAFIAFFLTCFLLHMWGFLRGATKRLRSYTGHQNQSENDVSIILPHHIDTDVINISTPETSPQTSLHCCTLANGMAFPLRHRQWPRKEENQQLGWSENSGREKSIRVKDL